LERADAGSWLLLLLLLGFRPALALGAGDPAQSDAQKHIQISKSCRQNMCGVRRPGRSWHILKAGESLHLLSELKSARISASEVASFNKSCFVRKGIVTNVVWRVSLPVKARKK